MIWWNCEVKTDQQQPVYCSFMDLQYMMEDANMHISSRTIEATLTLACNLYFYVEALLLMYIMYIYVKSYIKN